MSPTIHHLVDGGCNVQTPASPFHTLPGRDHSALVSCGSSNTLQSISISPASADAQNSPNGQVQFAATGTYANGSHVKPLTVEWSPGDPSTAHPWTTPVDSNGVASCGAAPAGTYPIWALAPADLNTPVSAMKQGTALVTGTAQLICP